METKSGCCMQAWEQQVASLSRQVANVTSEQEDAQRERQILLDSLRASEQVRMSYKTGLTHQRPLGSKCASVQLSSGS